MRQTSREFLGPGQIGAQLGEHAAAGLDRGELVGISDEHGLGSGCRCGFQQSTQIVGADHGGFVDHDQVEVAQCEGAVVQFMEGFGDGVAGVAGALADGDVDGGAGRGQHKNAGGVAAARHRRQRPQGGGLSRTGRGTAAAAPATVKWRCFPRRVVDPATAPRYRVP